MDQKLLFLINRDWTCPWLDRLMAIMSSTALWMVPLAILGAATLVCGGFRGRAFVVVAFCAFALNDGVIGRILKKTVGRHRPHQVEVGVRTVDLESPVYQGVFRPLKVKLSKGTGGAEDGRSFPSNHASNTAAVAFLATFFFRRWGWLAFIPAALVAYSRVYVGAHWPSDAAAGMALGCVVAWLTLLLAQFAWRRLGPRWLPSVARSHPLLISA